MSSETQPKPKSVEQQQGLFEEEKPPQRTFVERQSKELVLGFAGPIGCGISNVIAQTTQVLVELGYEVHHIKLSDFITDEVNAGRVKVNAEYSPSTSRADRYYSLQDAGNDLRIKYGADILAEFAVRDIVVRRNKEIEPEKANRPMEHVPKRVAFLIDQIKHQEEVNLLRTVYRNLFHLVGVISVYESRKNRLAKEGVGAEELSKLMERDRKQEEKNGQQLDKALQMADFFVRSDKGTVDSLNRPMRRFLELLHGKTGITPTHQEYGMYVAYAAGLRSACMSRQVGAAIASDEGEILSTGCNDVPKSGGGLYSFESKPADHRCVHKENQVCFNDEEKNVLKRKIGDALGAAQWTDLLEKEHQIPREVLPELLEEVFAASRIGDLIEFSRAVHAEMDAIIALARTGTPGVTGATLYTTTFPCHSCARHIVAAGISKVYYIEPYEKSLAQRLHSDAIAFESGQEEEDSREHEASSVKFIHFEGIAPRQYLNLFKMKARKDDAGRVIPIHLHTAQPSVVEYLDDYRTFESKVVAHLSNKLPLNDELNKNTAATPSIKIVDTPSN